WYGCDLAPTGILRAAMCVTRRGFNGRCSKRRSRTISWPTSRSAISHSIAPIRDTIFRAMRTLLLKSLFAAPATIRAPDADEAALRELGHALAARGRRLFGRSLTIREIDAGSCNGCELEIHALNNSVYDIERFGLRFAASPRHADVLLVTGPVTHNM